MVRGSVRRAAATGAISLIAAAAVVVGSGVAGTGGARSAPRADPTLPASTVATTVASRPTTTAAVVTEMHVVPAVRDVRVRVGGQVVASDSSGRIELPALSGEHEVVVLGYSATPPVQQVRFLQWSDGEPAAIRTVDLSEPVPDVEIEVLHRVVAEMTDEPSVSGDRTEPASIGFDSAIGHVELVPGTPAWVPALRAGNDGLIVYRPTGDATGPGRHEGYLPTPEARWLVSPR